MQTMPIDILFLKINSIFEKSQFSASTIEYLMSIGLNYTSKYFAKNQITECNNIIIEDFLWQMQMENKNNKLSYKNLYWIRRFCLIILNLDESKIYTSKDLCVKNFFNNPLRQELITSQLLDCKNIFNLVWNIKENIKKLNLKSDMYISYECYAFDKILKEHIKSGFNQYNEELINNLVNKTRNDYIKGAINCANFNKLRKISILLKDYYYNKAFKWNRIVNDSYIPLESYLNNYYNEFGLYLDNKEGYCSIRYIESMKSFLRNFLFELQESKIILEDLNNSNLNSIIVKCSEKYTNGLSCFLHSVSLFLKFLYDNEYIKTDFSYSTKIKIAKRRVIYTSFTNEQIDQILNVPNRLLPTENRNYAILLLAAQTGLRVSDIVSLCFDNIDWRENKISLIQQKTKKCLEIQLLPECGNAIADYILNFRPKCNLKYIFISKNNPYRKISTTTVYQALQQYLKVAGIQKEKNFHFGMHTFRRSFSKRLLESEVPINTIRQLLGHATLDSIKPYLSVDENNLKICSLNESFLFEDT